MSLSDIPLWVYFLFLILVVYGIKSCYQRVVKVKNIVILPIFLLIMSLVKTYEYTQIIPIVIGYWMFGCSLGVILGLAYAKNIVIYADKEKRLIKLPGDYFNIIIIMSIFLIQFTIHFLQDNAFSIASAHWFLKLTVFISGLFIGITSGRSANQLYKFYYASHTAL